MELVKDMQFTLRDAGGKRTMGRALEFTAFMSKRPRARASGLAGVVKL